MSAAGLFAQRRSEAAVASRNLADAIAAARGGLEDLIKGSPPEAATVADLCVTLVEAFVQLEALLRNEVVRREAQGPVEQLEVALVDVATAADALAPLDAIDRWVEGTLRGGEAVVCLGRDKFQTLRVSIARYKTAAQFAAASQQKGGAS